MPPKKPDAPSKKNEAAKKEKIVDDKTFGLKNKKGKKQQTFIKNVTHQIVHGDQKATAMKKEEEKKAAARQDKAALAAELNALFKPTEQKVAKGVDPKSVLCGFFKAGSCTKGHKCKFSHDLDIERKAARKNIYEEEKKEDGMEDWDEQKLEEVVNQKHGEKNKAMPATSIICKFFLDAVENNKYGWFWSCPNSDTCHYRHALPPGFVLKKDAKRMEDEKVVVSIEQLVEAERAALSGQSLTKVTIESFLNWKERKRGEKRAALSDEKEAKRQGVRDGKVGGVSGRELFEFNPELVMGGDDEGADDVSYKREDDADEDGEAVACQVRELTLEMLAEEATFVREPAPGPPEPEGAVGGSAEAAPAQNGLAADEDIDENLFDCEDLDDLDDLDDDDDDDDD